MFVSPDTMWSRVKALTWDKQKPGDVLSRRRKWLPDKSSTKGLGQELVAWLPFENSHIDLGSVLYVCVCVCMLHFLWKANLPLTCI